MPSCCVSVIPTRRNSVNYKEVVTSMSTHLTPSREDDTTMGPADSGGRRLRIARQSRGMTQGHVAEELHLNPAVIEALEREDYKSLPEPVFVTGYIRKYANLVGLDPKPLIAAYGVPPVRAHTDNPTAHAGRRRIDARYLTPGLIGVGGLLLVGVLGWFLWQWSQRPDPEPKTTAAEEVAEVAWETVLADMLDAVPESELSDFPTDAEDLFADQGLEQSPEPGSDPETSQQLPSTTTAATWDVTEENAAAGTTAAIDARPADTEETTAAKADEVEIIFDGPCWVDVRDKQEKYALSGTKEKGDRYVLGGTPPYSIKLGNKTMVRITVGGKPLDLSTVSRGGVARFTLDADGKVR